MEAPAAVSRAGGPVALTFDLILHEYPGYTDETILDLTMGRIRQMVGVIRERQQREREGEVSRALAVAQMQTSATGSMLAGLARTNKAARAIRRMALSLDFQKALRRRGEQRTADEPAPTRSLPSTAAVMRAMGVRPDGSVGSR